MKLGIISDLHSRDDEVDRSYWTAGDDQWREFSTWETRLTTAVTDFNAAGCDLLIQLGDKMDAHYADFVGDNAARAAAVSATHTDVNIILDTFSGDYVVDVLGNHEISLYGSTMVGNTSQNLTTFWAAVDASGKKIARENEFTDTDWLGPMAYTFDYQGVRFVVLGAVSQSSLSIAQQDWLYDGEGGGVLEVDMPCVILSHFLIDKQDCEGVNVYAYIVNTAGIQTLLETAGNVALVIQGHFHRNGVPGYGVDLHNVINGITYLALRGSVLGKDDGDTEEGATVDDSSHYVIDIKSLTVGGNGANVEVTGYKQGGSQAAKKYLVA